MSIDLHIHTTASDGNIHPGEVLNLAIEKGLKTIAFADHETTAGYEAVKDTAIDRGVEIICAVELQALQRDKEVHILGYLCNSEKEAFQSRLAELRLARTTIAKETVYKLNSFGFAVEWEDVKKLSHFEGPISKGHIMQALKKAGYINTREDATKIMTSYLNPGGKAYISYNFSAADAIELIKNAGGVPVVAHPGLINNDEIVLDLIKLGCLGLEVYYYYFGRNKNTLIKKYEAMAREYRLIMTGGSDYHGTITPVTLGAIYVPQKVRNFLQGFGQHCI